MTAERDLAAPTPTLLAPSRVTSPAGRRRKLALLEQVDDRETVSPALQAASTTLALVSLLILTLVEVDSEGTNRLFFWLAGQALALVASAVWLRRFAVDWPHPPVISPLLVLLGVSTFFWEAALRWLLGGGRPLEMQLMQALGNIVWGLAALGIWQRYQTISVVMSLFLTLFAGTSRVDVRIQALAGLFACGCVLWLIVSHWERFHPRLSARGSAPIVGWPLAVCVIVVVLAVAAGASSESRFRQTLQGLLPSSGGAGGSDPFSRDGVGQGEAVVAGTDNIQTFAAIDDAPFRVDERPSLYDIFDDTYDESFTTAESDRAIALAPQMREEMQEHFETRTEQVSREFSTHRRVGKKQRSNAADVRGRALFHVSGRTPLHLRLELFDLFDGVRWQREEDFANAPPLRLTEAHGLPWVRLADQKHVWEFLGPAETHALKIIRLDTNVIPAPLHLHGVHIAECDRADLFSFHQEGLLRMERKRLPELTPIHLASRSFDPAPLAGTKFIGSRPEHRQIPHELREQLEPLARDWTRGRPAGWQQVAAIRDRLRKEYLLDPEARAETSGRPPVVDFLFHSRRGPDYQFATATALLLRCLGYHSRVISGFYAAPERYDAQRRHTPVLPEDVHFWTEVRVAGGAWATVESTPGYRVLLPPPGFWQRFVSSVGAVADWVFGNLALSCGLLLLAAALRIWRFEILDFAQTHWLAWHGVEQSACRVWWIIERRLRWAGAHRPAAATPRRFLLELQRRRIELEDSSRHVPDRCEKNWRPRSILLEASQRHTGPGNPDGEALLRFLNQLEREAFSPAEPSSRFCQADAGATMLKMFTLRGCRAFLREERRSAARGRPVQTAASHTPGAHACSHRPTTIPPAINRVTGV